MEFCLFPFYREEHLTEMVENFLLQDHQGLSKNFLQSNHYAEVIRIGIWPNPLSPNSDENDISLYTITTCSNNQVMRV